MFRNYLKLAIRNLVKHKGYSLIGIFGLAFGMTFFLLLMVLIQYHQSMDSFHKNKDDIYLVYRECGTEHGLEKKANTGLSLAPLLTENFQGIKNSVRFTRFAGSIRNEHNNFSEDVIFADASVFKVFSFSLTTGNPETVLIEPYTMVITEDMARKYFDDENPIGRVVTFKMSRFNKNIDFKITGILDAIPGNSHMKFKFLASYPTLYATMDNYFLYDNQESQTLTYIQLDEKINLALIEKLFFDIKDNYTSNENYNSLSLKLKPLLNIYLDSNDLNGFFFSRGGSVKLLLTMFTVLSLFILLSACINFMNLSTAQATSRAMEVGLRKSIGGQKKQIIIQFLGETLVFSYLAILFAFLFLEIILPFYNSFTGLELKINYFSNFSFLISMITIATFTGLIAGIYPAVFMSRYEPSRIMKGIVPGGSHSGFRKSLIVFQLVISVIFIFGTITILNQIDFLEKKEIGFDKEHIVVLPIKDKVARQKYDVIKSELLKNSGIIKVAAASQVPFVNSQRGVKVKSGGVENIEMGIVYTDSDYLETLKTSLIEGGYPYRKSAAAANQDILINESAYAKLNLQTSFDKTVYIYSEKDETKIPLGEGQITGVVKNYIFRNFQQHVQPLLFKVDMEHVEYILFRINGQLIKSSLDAIKETFFTFAPEQPFDFFFLEDKVEQSYRFFQNFGSIVSFFSIIAILLSSLGLFGLAIYDAKRRIKEIGVRKVFGASMLQILSLLSKRYLLLILIGNLIALPLAGILMNKALQVFIYRIDLGPALFIYSILISVIIVLFSISWQAIRSANANPVESLKYE